MSYDIKAITTDDLRRMGDREGLILQGCGGDLQEWVDGITAQLAEAEILRNGSTFQKVSSFTNGELTCLLFDFEGADLAVGKLATWRLRTHREYGGTWLSDYVPNLLGGFIQKEQQQAKPDCELIGQDGNIFNLMGVAARTLRRNGMEPQAEEMRRRITDDARNYSEALGIIGEYVNITGQKEADMTMEMEEPS